MSSTEDDQGDSQEKLPILQEETEDLFDSGKFHEEIGLAASKESSEDDGKDIEQGPNSQKEEGDRTKSSSKDQRNLMSQRDEASLQEDPYEEQPLDAKEMLETRRSMLEEAPLDEREM